MADQSKLNSCKIYIYFLNDYKFVNTKTWGSKLKDGRKLTSRCYRSPWE